MKSYYALQHYAPVKRNSGYLGNISHRVFDYRRSISDRIGFKLGSLGYNGSPLEKILFFKTGLAHEIREQQASIETWRGLVIEMELAIGSIRWTRSLLDVKNWVKSIYSSIGDNLLTNGGGESGVWTYFSATTAPSTLEQSTTWKTQGTYSIHIAVAGGGIGKGAYVQQATAISTNTPYQMRLSVKVVSGTWQLVIAQAADHTLVLGSAEISDVGESVIEAMISDASTYSGNVDIWIASTVATGEIYCDAGVFQRGPMRAESDIHEDTTSQSEYGRIEQVLLRAGMKTIAANNEVESYLHRHVWPRSLPPSEVQLLRESEITLTMFLTGYGATLNFRNATVTGTDTCYNHVNALTAASEFVTAGYLQANANYYQIEQRTPVKVLDTLQQIADSGDGDGARWSIGVFENKKLCYEKVSNAIKYHFRNGKFYTVSNRIVDPVALRPGWVYLDDSPTRAAFAGESMIDDRNVAYMDEVEFIAPNTVSWHRVDDDK